MKRLYKIGLSFILRSRKYRFILAISFIALAPISAAERDSELNIKEIEQRQFEKMGLHKLSSDELEQLNLWLCHRTKNHHKNMHSIGSEPSKKEAVFGLKEKPQEPKELYSEIDGDFSGWQGKTLFRLKNGQIWKQRMQGRWRYKATDPKVKITRNSMGFYRMWIVDKNKSVAVTRVK